MASGAVLYGAGCQTRRHGGGEGWVGGGGEGSAFSDSSGVDPGLHSVAVALLASPGPSSNTSGCNCCCRGQNTQGNLGLANQYAVAQPWLIDSGFVYKSGSISAGSNAACAVLTNGELKCSSSLWANMGLPYIGSHTTAIVPTQLAGSAACWGAYRSKNSADSWVPVIIPGGYVFSQVAAGWQAFLGLLTSESCFDPSTYVLPQLCSALA